MTRYELLRTPPKSLRTHREQLQNQHVKRLQVELEGQSIKFEYRSPRGGRPEIKRPSSDDARSQ